MRKFILIASMVLVSAAAHAGPGRGLTLASNEEPAAIEQPKAVEQPKATEAPQATEAPKTTEAPKATETPAYVARPAAIEPTPEAPKADLSKPVTDKAAQAPKADKPRHRHESTEARVIYELHRHGIYW
jgi:hypothetical protein